MKSTHLVELMTNLALDHVPFACSDLDEMTHTFDRLGLGLDYGGPISQMNTHNAILVFEDGTFLEVISGIGDEPPRQWPREIDRDAGPCAWCVEVPDVYEELQRILRLGIAVHGPKHRYREEPSGARPEWDHGNIGSPEEHQKFPFIAAGRTPRTYRESPSQSVSDGLLRGIGEIVIGVKDLQKATADFRQLYHLPRPVHGVDDGFGARLASFPNEVLTLAEPLDGSELADRISTYGEIPCACFIETTDLERAANTYPDTGEFEWISGSATWFDSTELAGRLGLIEY